MNSNYGDVDNASTLMTAELSAQHAFIRENRLGFLAEFTKTLWIYEKFDEVESTLCTN